MQLALELAALELETLEVAVVRMKAEHAPMAASMAAAQERAVALAKEVAELHAERDALRSESGSGRRAVGEVEVGNPNPSPSPSPSPNPNPNHNPNPNP